jgi:hypothetical protein
MGQCGNIFGRVVLMNQWGKILGRGSFAGSISLKPSKKTMFMDDLNHIADDNNYVEVLLLR